MLRVTGYLAIGLMLALGPTARAGQLYFVDDQAIKRVSDDGTGLQTVVPNVAHNATYLSIAGGNIYWADTGRIYRADLAGGDPELVREVWGDVFGNHQSVFTGFDTHGGYAYWGQEAHDDPDTGQAQPEAVYRVPADD